MVLGTVSPKIEKFTVYCRLIHHTVINTEKIVGEVARKLRVHSITLLREHFVACAP